MILPGFGVDTRPTSSAENPRSPLLLQSAAGRRGQVYCATRNAVLSRQDVCPKAGRMLQTCKDILVLPLLPDVHLGPGNSVPAAWIALGCLFPLC